MSNVPSISVVYFLWSHERQAYVEAGSSDMTHGSVAKNIHVDSLVFDDSGSLCVKAHDIYGESVPPHMQ